MVDTRLRARVHRQEDRDRLHRYATNHFQIWILRPGFLSLIDGIQLHLKRPPYTSRGPSPTCYKLQRRNHPATSHSTLPCLGSRFQDGHLSTAIDQVRRGVSAHPHLSRIGLLGRPAGGPETRARWIVNWQKKTKRTR
jgi:hypothetical protein